MANLCIGVKPTIDRMQGFWPGEHSMYQRVLVAVLCRRIDYSPDLFDAMPALRGKIRQRPVVTPLRQSLRPYPDESVR